MLSYALRRWGPPSRLGLCSHLADVGATFDVVPQSQAFKTPKAAGVIYPTGQVCTLRDRPFESEIHGTVHFTQFCSVLLVTWCYRVLLSCYLRPK